MAEAGIYVATVVDKKVSRGEKFCILDGGMNHHLPASGNFGQVIRRNYLVVNISNSGNGGKEKITFVGPTCASIDIMGDRMEIEEPAIGDCMAFLNSGAYGYSVSPLFFLSHETPVELLVEDDEVDVIRRSYTVEIIRS